MRDMSLRTKSLTILGVVVLLATILNFGVLNYLVYPSFIELEQMEAQRNLKRTEDAIQNELSQLSTFLWDWAAWDDTYEFIENPSQEYVDSNLVTTTFSSNNINFIMYYNIKGKLIWGQIHDLILEEEIALEEMPSITLSPTHSLLNHTTLESALAGVMLTNRGPMLIASRPIVSSEDEGPIRGTLLMGRFLNGPIIETLREQTHVEFQIWPLDERPSSPTEQEALSQLETGKQIVLRETGDEVLAAYSLLLDYENRPAVLLRADTPRSISALGIQTLKTALLGILAAGVIVLVITWIMLRKVVISPIGRLTETIVSIGQTGNLDLRTGFERKDEIGILAGEFDEMLVRLREARQTLLEQSYYGGMAETAAAMLHNVRNAINPVTVTCGNLLDTLSQGTGEKLLKALKELREKDVDAGRKEKLREYVDEAMPALSAQMHDGLESIRDQSDHIERILYEQEDISRIPRLQEVLDVAAVIRDAGKLFPEDAKIRLSLNTPAGLSPVRGNSLLLMQVLGNLLVNSKEAIEGADPQEGLIEIDAREETVAGRRVLHITVKDNGDGIEPDQMAKIFERGYSTRKDKVAGLGLHWCANSAKAMGGWMSVSSDGHGCGATVHIYLPVATDEELLVA